MSETMNLRPFSNLPETDEIKEGDKVLVNQDGMAKQLDASKISGSGGGTVYGELTVATSVNIVVVYADENHNTQLTYEQAMQMFKGGAIIFGTLDGVPAIVTPLAVVPNDEARAFQMIACVEEIALFTVICADTITG